MVIPCTTPTPVSLFSAQSIWDQYVCTTLASALHTLGRTAQTNLHVLPPDGLNHLDAHEPVKRALPFWGHVSVVKQVHAHAVRDPRLGRARTRERSLLRRERERVDRCVRDRGRDEDGERAPARSNLQDLSPCEWS